MEIHEDSIGWDIQLAKKLKEITDVGQQPLGAMIGTVTKMSPLTISLYAGNLIIQSNVHDIFLSDRLKKCNEVSTNSHYCSGDRYNPRWGVGQKVLVMADSDNSVFFVVDVFSEVR